MRLWITLAMRCVSTVRSSLMVSLSPVTRDRLADANAFPSGYISDEQIVVSCDGGALSWRAIACPRYTKRYADDPLEADIYLDPHRGAGWIAYADGRPVGQILVRRWWNGLAYVDDLRVHPEAQRQGIGRALLARARAWAHDAGLPGVMVETQHTNAPACRFYAACGLELGGLDRCLYRGTECAGEVVLFWYAWNEGAPDL